MLNPPFKLASSHSAAVGSTVHPAGCCAEADAAAAGNPGASVGRSKLQALNPYFHCSVIGTCLSTAELRKVISRFTDVHGRTDIDVHHDAVSLANDGGPAAKALNKALDQRHDAAIQQFNKARGEEALAASWSAAQERGEVPGAYWALLTHRDVTEALRQKVFGEVHMLSHLVGAANRADIRRLVSLEQENAELHEKLERQQQRSLDTLAERDEVLAQLKTELSTALGQLSDARDKAKAAAGSTPDAEAQASQVAVQTARRERAEQAAAGAQSEAARLQEEMEQLRRHLGTMQQELSAAESELRAMTDAEDEQASALAAHLHGRRVLYVGGRPSSIPAIRGLVEHHGGSFQRHDGGMEDRKGILSSAVAAADLVVFPVDCVDHDSVGNLKRLCVRLSIAYMPLRSASVASFAAAVANRLSGEDAEQGAPRPPFCPRHG